MNFYSSGASLYKIMNLSEVVFHVRIVFDIFSIDCGVMYIRDGVCGGVIVAGGSLSTHGWINPAM